MLSRPVVAFLIFLWMTDLIKQNECQLTFLMIHTYKHVKISHNIDSFNNRKIDARRLNNDRLTFTKPGQKNNILQHMSDYPEYHSTLNNPTTLSNP